MAASMQGQIDLCVRKAKASILEQRGGRRSLPRLLTMLHYSVTVLWALPADLLRELAAAAMLHLVLPGALFILTWLVLMLVQLGKRLCLLQVRMLSGCGHPLLCKRPLSLVSGAV